MAKKVANIIKLQIDAGKANPSPPVGPALGQAGVNIMDFCKAFNDATKEQQGPIPVVITVYEDRSFTFVTKVAPASYLIKQAMKLKKGSSAPGKDMVGKVSMAKLREVAEIKMKDLNTTDIDAAARIMAGTAVSMGLEVVE